MSELRLDPILNRWVIVAPARGMRPQGFDPDPQDAERPSACPMCEGNERMTPNEIFAVRDRGEPDKPGWYVRVVPNKFPALRVEGNLEPRRDGLFERMDGVGAHEIVIETPDHTQDLAFMPQEQIIRVITAQCQRVEDLQRDARFRQVIVFRNHRKAAGATLGHPHSQVMAVPIIPRCIQDQLASAARHEERNGTCLFCDVLAQELSAGERIVLESDGFVAFVPYASMHPYTTVIYPRSHGHQFPGMSAQERADLADVLRRVLLAYRAALFDAPYNLIYHTAPNSLVCGLEPDCENLETRYHWHVEIIPRVGQVAGFERGTGLYINPVAPESAAKELQQAVG
ncbi:MAG: galactose-1-phosphate uridylyltransferase [Armatimonadetes bacterium]|nr:galactose-1-phosphate uridylyltransferase [Armatimonadota bacterium]